jgi:hypothetical protein
MTPNPYGSRDSAWDSGSKTPHHAAGASWGTKSHSTRDPIYDYSSAPTPHNAFDPLAATPLPPNTNSSSYDMGTPAAPTPAYQKVTAFFFALQVLI